MLYDSRVIRALLIEAYGDEALTALCFDYFRPVHREFTLGMTMSQKVQLLLEYSSDQPRGQETLLQLVQGDNPEKFSEYEPRLQVLEGPLLADITAPYRGLEAFYEEHAHLFFGREALTRRLRRKLKKSRFLAVIGPSGSGKSSLARAGLLPLLRKEGWAILAMRPGPRPLEILALCLAREFGNGSDPEQVRKYRENLNKKEDELHLAVSLAVGETPAALLVDQFEEVFTLCRDADERQRFIANLLHAATVEGGPLAVIPTMRADFYGRCAFHRDLAQQLEAHQALVRPMSEEELRGAIERPARIRGVSFEEGLVDQLVEGVLGEEGALPLLQHALLELWTRRDEERRLITARAYVAMGGVRGAIAHRAELVYNRVTEGGQVTEKDRPEEQQEGIRRIVLRLVTPGEGTEGTRRRARLDEFGSAEEAELIQEMADARLLTTARDPETGAETVDVAHEALIRGWPRLREWIEENREDLRTHRRLTEAAQEWERLGRDDSYLYRGVRLAEADEWSLRHGPEMNPLEREFLEAGVALRVREQAARVREQAAREQRRALLSVVAGLLGGSLGGMAGEIVRYYYFFDGPKGVEALSGFALGGFAFGILPGVTIALGIGFDRLRGEQRRSLPIIGGVVAGMLAGAFLGLSYGESGGLLGILVGGVYGGGIALSVAVGKTLMGRKRFLVRAIMGTLVGLPPGVIVGKGNFIVSALVGFGIAAGIGIVDDLFQTEVT
jgi:energy-coupling factor transporter ATP-binding protein EcfA2